MKKIISFFTLMVVLAGFLLSCGKNMNGELVGIYSTPWFEPEPFGMVYVPRGSFVMGPNDQDVNWSFNSQNKTVGIESFWIDDTEITNGEYKQFVNAVRDSVTRLAIYKNQLGMNPDAFARTDREGNVLFYDEYNDIPLLNYEEKISNRDPDLMYDLDTMFYYQSNVAYGKQLKTHKLNYTYVWVDYIQASLRENKFEPLLGRYNRDISPLLNGETTDSSKVMVRKDESFQNEDGTIINRTYYKALTDRNDFIMSRTINIYPDTLSWTRDFTFSFNEPYMMLYFSHPGYADYPVVGVTWEQANAFCHWRTALKNNYLASKGEPFVQKYRLPMESEWEYAARGGRRGAMYPWGGPYTRKSNGCFLANFKPMRGSFTDDGFLIPAKVGSYPPNDYNLYDMAGNVAEWTSTAYSESTMAFLSDINPNYQYNAASTDPRIMKRKVVRGGSWKDVAYFLQCGVATYEYQDEAHPYIGFRCARTFIGPE